MVKANKNIGSQRDCQVKAIVVSRFSFFINMANLEAFWGVKKLSANLSFLKCVPAIYQDWDVRGVCWYMLVGVQVCAGVHMYMCTCVGDV